MRFRVENEAQLRKRLREQAARAKREYTASVVVGYTAEYAVYVHENMPALQKRTHTPPGQPKFLEQPARQRLPDLRRELRKHLTGRAMKFGEILMALGRLLKDWSQALVPIDTGTLRDSARVRREK